MLNNPAEQSLTVYILCFPLLAILEQQNIHICLSKSTCQLRVRNKITQLQVEQLTVFGVTQSTHTQWTKYVFMLTLKRVKTVNRICWVWT